MWKCSQQSLYSLDRCDAPDNRHLALDRRPFNVTKWGEIHAAHDRPRDGREHGHVLEEPDPVGSTSGDDPRPCDAKDGFIVQARGKPLQPPKGAGSIDQSMRMKDAWPPP